MRTAVELFQHLKMEAARRPYLSCALAVAFPRESKLVHHNEADAVEQIQTLLAIGGKAVGTVGAIHAGGAKVDLHTRPLPEFERTPGIGRFLKVLASDIAEQLVSKGVVKPFHH